MAAVDWLWILHPFLAVVLVYPLIGVVVRLAVQTRARRLQKQKLPVTVGRDHIDQGGLLGAVAKGLVLISLTAVIGMMPRLAPVVGRPITAVHAVPVLLRWRVHLLDRCGW